MLHSEESLKLKINKTFKEYDYLKSEYEYINHISDVSDKEFMRVVREYLDKEPTIKEVYNNKEIELIEKNLKSIKSNINIDKDVESLVYKKKSKKSKYLYRQIVKKTHPDKIIDSNLNDLYIRATNGYEEDDIGILYVISKELNIPLNISEEDLIYFEDNIKNMKKDIQFITSTFAYKWSQTNNDDERINILISFIKTKLM